MYLLIVKDHVWLCVGGVRVALVIISAAREYTNYLEDFVNTERLDSQISFLREIESKINRANNIIQTIDDMNYTDYSSEVYRIADHNSYSEELEDCIKEIHISVSVLLEATNYPIVLQSINAEISKYWKNLSQVKMSVYAGVLYSEPLLLLARHVEAMSFLLNGEQSYALTNNDVKRFEGILRNTPYIINERGIEPHNEAEVRKCVYNILIHTFPDTVREIPIAQVSKVYKPDLGVRSLKAAAEYKFADSIDEVKHSIGGFYEDMRGYAGSSDWVKFYAVIYTTKPLFTQQQLESEFDLTKADKNWVPIIVHGPGGRKPKAKK